MEPQPAVSEGRVDTLSTIALICFGVFVGAYGALVGIGGGFLIVPALVLLFDFSPPYAVGTSLTVVFLNAVSATISYARQRRIDYRTGLTFAVATLPGAVVGAYLSAYLTAFIFNLLFGVLLVALALFLLLHPEGAPRSVEEAAEAPRPTGGVTQRTIVDARGEVYVYTFSERGGVAVSFVVGFLSSMLGIGGGIIHVPAMVYLFGFPAHIATATSQFILAISTGMGTASHLALGHVQFLPAVLLGIGVVVGAQLGAALSHRLHGRWLIRLLSFALIFVGIRLVLEELS